uniref:Uncharacterized protein n=1 Tax=Anguilla anguilla TaxID=7936 RepID=A0A0E9WJL5_ANGAN
MSQSCFIYFTYILLTITGLTVLIAHCLGKFVQHNGLPKDPLALL